MKTILISFFATLLPFIVIDGTYLFTIGGSFYQKHIGHLMAPSVNFVPAVIFYLLYIVGILAFVVLPALKGGQGLAHVFAFGALLGLVAYGTYDLTNQSTLKSWPTIVTIVDLAWGAFLTGATATIAVWISRTWN